MAGQAKKRGSFEQRKKAAIDKRLEEIKGRKNLISNLKKDKAGRLLSLFSSLALSFELERGIKRIENTMTSLHKRKEEIALTKVKRDNRNR